MEEPQDSDQEQSTGLEIAVIGMAGRFPGAPDVETFWQNLAEGRESIRFFSDEELAAAGVDREDFERPNYVPASGYLDDPDLFDASYFGLNPREAELMDPQHRIFLEIVVEALERAGYAGAGEQVVGVYAGASENSYFVSNLLRNSQVLNSVGVTQAMIGIQKDFLATRVSYKLDLRGPSLTVQTACSTSLVATHLACQALVSGECDVAVAGGVSVRVPGVRGYLFEDDGILSPDGHCRSFDAMARGTVGGSGAGAVVLRRLGDALADGDPIQAVIKGTVINNDGSLKAGFTAPSVDGQAMVVRTAHLVAEVDPETISYVEAHGTATPLGDPIEFAALNQAFEVEPEKEPFCALGSVKSNIGHLDAAAGVVSLIKTVLALEHRLLPPTVHFEKPNPQIDFAASPFYVSATPRPWPVGATPRRAGVSSFGIGGTNAHLILEEAPPAAVIDEPSTPPRPQQLIVLSAHTASALETLTDRMEEHLRQHPGTDLADLAYTLQVGRWPLRHRRVLLSQGLEDAAQGLAGRDPRRLLEGRVDDDGLEVFFLFSGLGEQAVGMGRDLFEQEPTFRQAVDHCCEFLLPHLGVDLRDVLYPPESPAGDSAEEQTPAAPPSLDLRALRQRARQDDSAPEAVDEALVRTEWAHPAVFVVGYALTELWEEWGIQPQGTLGYSLGEYLAAWQAGVFSLEDALLLVSERAQLIQQLPAGGMLAVPLGEGELLPLLVDELSLAAVNAPSLSVVAGPLEVVERFQSTLSQKGVTSQVLNTEHAFHSSMMQPIAQRFRELVARVPLAPPQTPYISNVTGTWIRPEDAVDPEYWVRHLCETVRFSEGVEKLLQKPRVALLEIGPGRSLTSFVRQHEDPERERTVTSCLPPTESTGLRGGDFQHLQRSLGLLWLSGVPVDWSGFSQHQQRRRLRLPTYPFERQRYWIEPTTGTESDPFGIFRTSSEEPMHEVPQEAPAPSSASHGRPHLATPFVAPEGALEAAVAGIWQGILGISQVGAHDDFFELGGHSLLATRVLSSLQKTFHVEVSLGRFFTARTVAELTRVITELRGADGSHAAVEIPPAVGTLGAAGEQVYPVSLAQRRLWFLDQLAPGNAFYNLCSVLRLRGPLRLPALVAAFTEIVRRHESLRTTFVAEEGQPLQVIHPQARGWEVATVDLSALETTVRQQEMDRRTVAESLRPFDLTAGPLLRTTLLRLGQEEHILVLTQHHIISDAWSMGVFSRELEMLYSILAGSVEGPVHSPLPDLPLRYVDFAVWQREQLSGQRLEELLGYWQEQLGADPPSLDLPTDRPRPKAQAFQGAALSVQFSADLLASLYAVGRRQGTTLAMLLLAAFHTLLFLMTGQKKIVVGSPIAGRDRAELEGLIGFFVNTLAMVADLEGDPAPTFEEFLGRSRDRYLEAHAHQDLPFEKLVEGLGLDRDLSRNPLFQVVLALQNAPMEELKLPDLELDFLPFEVTATRFDLEFHLSESPHGLDGVCLYDTALFDRTTVQRLLGHYQNLLSDLAQAPEKRLTELVWLGDGERHQVLLEWSETSAPQRPHHTLPELFEQQAGQRPDAVALVSATGCLSYGELNLRSNHLAGLLGELGGGRQESAVGVCLDRSLELVVGLLGILKGGGFYVPLDPDSPPERLQWTAEDAGISVLLSRRELIPGLLDEVRRLDVESLAGRDAPTDQGRQRKISDQHLAYVMYTSGSTGTPKGVAVPHRGVVRLVHQSNFMELGPEESFLQLAPISFDASTLEIWGPLLNGGRLVIFEPGVPSLTQVGEALGRHRISTLWLTAGLFHQMVDDDLSALGGVRQLLAGGDVLSSTHVRRVVEQLRPGHRLINGYGPTENTTFTTCYPMAVAAQVEESVSIGRPIQQTRVLVVDGRGRGVPTGVRGELWMGGEGLARGYSRRPALTASRFVPNAFSGLPGERIYRGGDLVRFLADGRLEFFGRLDQQVKLRGFRIELGEIEAVLGEESAVREAVVIAREDHPGDRRLVAFVTLQEVDSSTDAVTTELRDALRRRLPEYMIPSKILVLEELPLGATGKVDRRALRKVEVHDTHQASYVAPRTPMEELLTGIWEEVLHRAGDSKEGGSWLRIGAEDDFFELGGHSLLATRVLSRVRERLGVELAVRELFEAPTVAALARCIEGAQRSPLPPLVRREDDGPPPLSFAQERLWFLDRLVPGSTHYNVSGALRLTGILSVEALRCAFEEIVCRHEALRTRFAIPADQGSAIQEILDPAPRALPLVDLVGVPEAAACLRHVLRREANRPFDLEQGPLFRTLLLRRGEQEHVLLLVVHHIVFDAWSMGILVRELGLLYEAFRRSQASDLPAQTITYADFTVWQRQWLSEHLLEEQLAFWKAQLAGVKSLELPTDRPRPAVQSFAGGLRSFHLPATLSEELRGLSRRQGTTLFMTLLAAFQALLARTSGQADIPVGSPIANRNVHEVENLVGFFVNTLVLRTEVKPRQTFLELVAGVREAALKAYAHQDLPMEHLVAELGVERDLSRSPLFQVMFVLQNAFEGELRLPGLVIAPEPVRTETAKFDLTLSMSDSDGGIVGDLEYSTNLFDATTIQRWLKHLEILLQGICEHPARRLEESPWFSGAEQHQFLLEWNDTATARTPESSLPQRFEAQAAQTPDAVAVVFEKAQLSYAELQARTHRLAYFLRREHAVGAEDRVALCVERSVEMVVGILGILKAGAAYVPLDPNYPQERLAFLQKDSGVTILLTQERLLDRLPNAGPGQVLLDDDWRRIASFSPLEGMSRDGAPTKRKQPEREQDRAAHAAYVLYTSGSTGRPKGVVNSHVGILNRLDWMASAGLVKSSDRVLQKTPLSFDVSVWELFSPLLVGATLVVARPEGHGDSAYLARQIASQRISLLHFVPSMMEAFLKEPQLLSAPTPSVARVVSSGEALPNALAQRFSAHPAFTRARLYNLYGPTEAAVEVTAQRWDGEERGFGVPIGRPLANTRLALFDRDFRLVPMGVVGELHLLGVQLARAYLGRPGLTAERFVPAPCMDHFAAAPGERMYRTGDLARYLADGRVEFLGRIDQQVKLRGYRIELGEIEALLTSHPAVRAASVVAVAGRGGALRLVAFCVVPEAPVRSLRQHLREQVPEHMVPATFVALEALPLLPNGKVDRAALTGRVPAAEVEFSGATSLPRGAVEELLAGIWSELFAPGLGRGRIDPETDFFALGGHSLLATQLISRIRQSFGVDLAVREVFDAPTLGALGQRIEAARRALEGAGAAGWRGAIPPLVRRSGDHSPPLSFAQQRLWFLDQLMPQSAFYNMFGTLRLEGPLQVAALAASMSEIVRRHQSLRTTVTMVEGEAVQRIHPEAPHALPLVDLASLAPRVREDLARRWVREESQRPFDLTTGPLFRSILIRLDKAEHLLLVSQHHIISDGWSMGIFQRELATLYEAFCHGQPSPLAELTVQYADFAQWQRGWLRGEVLEAQLDFWKVHLGAEIPTLELPVDHPRPAVQSFQGGMLPVRLGEPLSESLRALSRQQGTTLAMTLLAGFHTLLYRTTGQERIFVGSPVANRTWGEIESMIGFFVNSLTMVGDLTSEQPSQGPTFHQLLSRVRENSLEAYDHQDLPFEKLVEELQLERDLSINPLFQVMFALQNLPLVPLELGELHVRPEDSSLQSTRLDVEVYLQEGPEGIAGICSYNRDLFDTTTVRRLLGRYETLLTAAVASPEVPLRNLPSLRRGERHQCLKEWSGDWMSAGDEGTLIELFERQVERTPAAVAVVWRGVRMSYGELNRRANQLAHRLRALGVGREVAVGLCLERSPDLLAALLGILKAGGFFVPLDPEYPAERRAFLLQDAQISVLVSRSRLVAELPSHGATLLCLEAQGQEILGQRDDNPELEVWPGQLAYAIYTSGSTGKPKGAAIEHRSAVALLRWAQETFSLPQLRGVLASTSISFDLSVFELLAPLSCGGCVILVNNALDLLSQPEGNGYGQAPMEKAGITLVNTVPSVLAEVLKHKSLPASVRVVNLAGEPLPGGLVKQIYDGGAVEEVWNLYGPSEDTTYSTAAHVPRGEGRPPIGRPLSGGRTHLFDERGEPVPLGVPGELYLAGAGLARTYLGRPALTAWRFVPNPLVEEGEVGTRLYRTGDLARHRSDGELEFLGRLDDQVKIRGFRIEPGEVEGVLAAHPEVAEAAVVVARGNGGEPALVAFVSAAHEAGEGLETALPVDLKRHLPKHMVPARTVLRTRLPRLPNGKIDRSALVRDALSSTTEEKRQEMTLEVESLTDLQRLIAQIWEEVLANGRVRLHDNFFEVGGHSLSMLQVWGKLKMALDRELTLVTMFQYPTIGSLARHLGAETSAMPSQGRIEQQGEERQKGRRRLARRLQRRKRVGPRQKNP